MKTIKTTWLLILIMISTSVIFSCKKKSVEQERIKDNITVVDNNNNDNNYNEALAYSSVKVRTNIVGLVVNENNDGVSNAEVSIHGHTYQTDNYGVFAAYDVLVPENRTYVKVLKDGYFTGSRAFITRENDISSIRIMLQEKAPTGSVNASTGGEVTISNGSGVLFPANAVVNMDGTLYTGDFDVAIKYIDPTESDMGEIMPGDMNALTADGDIEALVSYGMLNVELFGNSGQTLQVAAGKTVSLSVAVPIALQGQAPASIPLWYFDEDLGIWKEDGQATLQGGKYVGEVGHFTIWGGCWSGPRAILRGQVLDCNGNSVASAWVYSYNTITNNGMTTADVNGNYGFWVPAHPTVIVNVYATSGGYQGSTLSLGPFTGGQVVAQNLAIPCPAYLEGTLVDCAGAPQMGALLVMQNGHSKVVGVNGAFSIPVFANTQVDILGQGENGEVGTIISYNSGSEQSITSIGNIAACGIQFENSYTISGGIYNNHFISFSPQIMGNFYYHSNSGSNSGNIYESGVGSMYIGFAGATTGSFVSQSNSYSNDYFLINIPGGDLDTFNVSQIHFDVTQYGAVGEPVIGTFQGTLTSDGGTNYAISNGKFAFIRQQ